MGIGLEFYELKLHVRFLEFVAQKSTERASGECGVENYAVVRLARTRSAPSAAADRCKPVFQKFPVCSLGLLRRINFSAQVRRRSLSERNAGKCLANFV